MDLQRLNDLCRGPRLKLVANLKRYGALSVPELAERLGMSSMGVRQHCQALERLGYLGAFRRPTEVGSKGRPRLLYHLRAKVAPLFPRVDDLLTLDLLESARVLYGEAAGEKLLYQSFRRQAEAGLARVAGGNLAERVARWTQWREGQGYLAFMEEDGCGGFRVEEVHSPLLALYAAFPELMHRLEEQLWAQVLETRVIRQTMGRDDPRWVYLVAGAPRSAMGSAGGGSSG